MSSKCTPVCPFRAFYCTKKALLIKRVRGVLEAWCAWTGDKCIGYKCQFATCTKHALLPDGTCRLKLGKTKRRQVSIEEQAARIEQEMGSIRGKLKKLGYDLDRLE
ncbi:MAG: hypothetical protein B6U94_03050 [Thermofilum sp. ex4484_79]|nr:MAG: hypothetical protein B6U94_03050 [Thermofilum sp. ex4484_79]